MAHVAKYKASSVGHMLSHYRRDQSSLERENIDKERTESNFVLGFGTDGVCRVRDQSKNRVPTPNWDTVQKRREAAFRAARAAEAVGVADTGARAVPEPRERPEHSQGRSEGQDGKAPSTIYVSRQKNARPA